MHHHAALIERIRTDDRPVTLLVAPAGFGKTVFAGQLARAVDATRTGAGVFDGPGWRILDIGPDGMPPDGLSLEGPGRLVILCRPGAEPRGLSRARLYDRVQELPSQSLLLPRETLTQAQWRASAGWAVLAGVGAGAPRRDDVADYLATEVLADLSSADLMRAAMDPEGSAALLTARIPPLAHGPQTPIRALLPGAVEQALGLRLVQEGPESLGWSDSALPQRPDLAARLIVSAAQAGSPDTAARLFGQSGGWYLFYSLPPETFADLVDHLPDTGDTEITLARTLLALKAGETDWARRHFGAQFGPEALDLHRALGPSSALPLRVQVFRIVLLIYEDIPVTDPMLEAMLAVLARLPLAAHLPRGSCYNALLEVFLRQRQYPQAEDVALRAAQAYERGQAPLLRFYIALHRAVMRLLRGESGAAQPELEDARIWLARVAFDSPGDARILRLVEAAARFETGDPAPMLSFLDEDLDAFSGGETWPTLVELAVLFGAQAYAEQVSTGAALAYLDRWWVRLAMNRQFRVLLELRKAQVLQNAGRWGAAARALSPIQARIDRVWIESADSEFARLATRDDIMLALCWLRQIAYEHPRLPYLGRKLDQMAANARLTGRQRIALDIWRAHVAHQTREPSQMRALLRSVFETVARNGVLSALADEQVFLSEMWRDAGTASYLSAVGPARAVMRRLEESRFSFGSETARAHLTRQELKVLMMLTEGASNKIIARQLAVSEPTVKFHLKNLYAKLGCHRRAEAVQAARALGWVQ